ncbi:hypothetical protein KSP40_PGU007665 [Platanthera guangdongensis]|uniref:Uncharacterized protein n=1 Tax=Platanthera guangdongensis TaxID=2320717 RepID=A0ABR2MDP5_9ASPA
MRNVEDETEIRRRGETDCRKEIGHGFDRAGLEIHEGEVAAIASNDLDGMDPAQRREGLIHVGVRHAGADAANEYPLHLPIQNRGSGMIRLLVGDPRSLLHTKSAVSSLCSGLSFRQTLARRI